MSQMMPEPEEEHDPFEAPAIEQVGYAPQKAAFEEVRKAAAALVANGLRWRLSHKESGPLLLNKQNCLKKTWVLVSPLPGRINSAERIHSIIYKFDDVESVDVVRQMLQTLEAVSREFSGEDLVPSRVYIAGGPEVTGSDRAMFSRLGGAFLPLQAEQLAASADQIAVAMWEADAKAAGDPLESLPEADRWKKQAGEPEVIEECYLHPPQPLSNEELQRMFRNAPL